MTCIRRRARWVVCFFLAGGAGAPLGAQEPDLMERIGKRLQASRLQLGGGGPSHSLSGTPG
jgi:hypothetical protein